MIPFTDLKSQYIEAKTEIDSAFQRIMETSNFITGRIVTEFEGQFAEYCNSEACASTGSGTNALMCALMACGIKDGDEVITTPHTFISTSEAIIWQGAKPVFVDIDEYYQIDVDKIEQHITGKTRAILFVDMYGQTPDIDRLRQIADRHNLYLIEDAAHSIASEYKGRRVGSLSDLTCFSFNPVKNLGAIGDAGAITGSAELIARARMFRDHGRENKWNFDLRGINARIDNLQALVVLAKMKYLDGWLTKRKAICRRYTQELKDVCLTPKENPNSVHTYYVYVIQVPKRDAFISYMKENGVEVNIHYIKSLTEQPVFAEYGGNCPVCEDICEKIVSLPCYHTLSLEQQDKIIGLTKVWLKSH